MRTIQYGLPKLVLSAGVLESMDASEAERPLMSIGNTSVCSDVLSSVAVKETVLVVSLGAKVIVSEIREKSRGPPRPCLAGR